MSGLRIGELCAGYGGLAMAVQSVLGGDLAWVADNDPRAGKILAHRYPGVPNLGDITTTDWTAVEPVDIFGGGYPCQPFSDAGLRKGTDDERHIWPYFVTAIRVLRPRLVVLENVRGHLGRGFDVVLGDLAALGFDAEWCLVPASGVGACHRRLRLFIIAWPAEDTNGAAGRERGLAAAGEAPGGRPRADAGRSGGTRPAADAPGDTGRVEYGDHVRPRRGTGRHKPDAGRGVAADADGRGFPELAEPHGVPGSGIGASLRHDPERLRDAAADPAGDGRNEGRPEPARILGGSHAAVGGGSDPEWASADYWQRDGSFGVYERAVRRHERVFGRPVPAPVEPGRNGKPRLAPQLPEWMMGLPAGWVTDVSGLSANDQLHAIGNGVVPRQGAAAIRLLLSRAPEALRSLTALTDAERAA